jgi:GntR family transcriptional regulator/MocR family aminotransferase
VYPVTPLYAPASAADRPQVAGLVVGYASLDARSIHYGVQLLEKVLGTLREGKA